MNDKQTKVFLRPYFSLGFDGPSVNAHDNYWMADHKYLVDFLKGQDCLTDMTVLKKCKSCTGNIGTFIRVADSEAGPVLQCFTPADWQRVQNAASSDEKMNEIIELTNGRKLRLRDNEHIIESKADRVAASPEEQDGPDVPNGPGGKPTWPGMPGWSGWGSWNTGNIFQWFGRMDFAKFMAWLSKQSAQGDNPFRDAEEKHRVDIPGRKPLAGRASLWHWRPDVLDAIKSTARVFMLRKTVFAKINNTQEQQVLKALEQVLSTSGMNIRFAGEYIHVMLFSLSCVSYDMMTVDPRHPLKSAPEVTLDIDNGGKQLFEALYFRYAWNTLITVHRMVQFKVGNQELWKQSMRNELINVFELLRQSSVMNLQWPKYKIISITKVNGKEVYAWELVKPAEKPAVMAGGIGSLSRSSRMGAVGDWMRARTEQTTDLRELAGSPHELEIVQFGRMLRSRFTRVVPDVMASMYKIAGTSTPPDMFQQDVAFISDIFNRAITESNAQFSREADKAGLTGLALRSPEKSAECLDHHQTILIMQMLIGSTYSLDEFNNFFEIMQVSDVRADGKTYATVLSWYVVNRKITVSGNLCGQLIPDITFIVRTCMLQHLSVHVQTLKTSSNASIAMSPLANFAANKDAGQLYDELTKQVNAVVSKMRQSFIAPAVTGGKGKKSPKKVNRSKASPRRSKRA
jgi:hypothetical protein